ncbi:MAG TPA: hypothetical protein PK405_07885, partial [Hyphomicrobiales bacterium]|nr:hypothetical protein [Hyphomicrobiales bacterium]
MQPDHVGAEFLGDSDAGADNFISAIGVLQIQQNGTISHNGFPHWSGPDVCCVLSLKAGSMHHFDNRQ